MKFTGEFTLVEFDLRGYQQALHSVLIDELSRCAVLWMGASLDIIPVWSGASHATFQGLASIFSFNLEDSSVSDAPDGTNLGASLGQGKLEFSHSQGIYQFTYSTTLPHLIFNEYNNANTHGFHLTRPGPYHFQNAARAVFEQAAKDARLPNPFLNLKTRKIKVG